MLRCGELLKHFKLFCECRVSYVTKVVTLKLSQVPSLYRVSLFIVNLSAAAVTGCPGECGLCVR